MFQPERYDVTNDKAILALGTALANIPHPSHGSEKNPAIHVSILPGTDQTTTVILPSILFN